VYWESPGGDDVGPASNDRQFEVKWERLADMSTLNTMPPAQITVSGTYEDVSGETHARIKLTNNSNHVAFFVRAEIAGDLDGLEVLPIRYDDNYVTVFPRESHTIEAIFASSLLPGHKPVVRIEGYDVAKQVVSLAESKKH
jgi:exo-1,4-beta-D-glucosaminidase